MKRLKSYTLLELIVVMALSGIVLLNAIGLYLFVQKNFIAYKNQKNQEIELVQFINVFNNDLMQASEINYNGEKLEFIKSNGKKIEYTSTNNEIIRTSNKTDRFNLSIENIKVMNHDNFDLIKEIQVSISNESKKSTLNFYKEYENSTIVNHEMDLIENGN